MERTSPDVIARGTVGLKLKESTEGLSPEQISREEQILKELGNKDPLSKGWFFYTHNELAQHAGNFPSISLALRHSIPNLIDKFDYLKEVLD